MPEVQLQSKRIPPPWFFSAGHWKEKGVLHKQLTNSVHLTTVNQLQKVLEMRESRGGKSFLDKRYSCSDQKAMLCVGWEEVVQ